MACVSGLIGSVQCGAVQYDLPADLRAGRFQCFAHRAVFLHRELNCTLRFFSVDRAVEIKHERDFLPERRFFAFFAFAFYVDSEILYLLFLFFQDQDDVDRTATAGCHEQGLHRAHTFVVSADFRISIELNGNTILVARFEMKGIVESLKLNFHKTDFYPWREVYEFTNCRGKASIRPYLSRIRYRFVNSHSFRFPGEFITEGGARLSQLDLFYCSSGTFIPGKSKVAWICHALTASADCEDWWPGLTGPGKAIDPAEYFIVCVNIPSSCYGSTGPLSTDPETGKPWHGRFPVFTIRDIVRSFIALREHLGIQTIDLLAGGSMGGYQCLEWALMEPARIGKLMLVATSAKESAWGIAIHTAQRLAIETDKTFGEKRDDAGSAGLKTARAIGMLTYRSYRAFVDTQTDTDDRTDDFRVSSYIHYQGEKLVKRFNAYSYWLLTKTMDSHNAARGRGRMADVLRTIQAKTICIGISSDFLCPVAEQKEMAAHIPGAQYVEIDSPFGHDGFLVEGEKIGAVLRSFVAND